MAGAIAPAPGSRGRAQGACGAILSRLNSLEFFQSLLITHIARVQSGFWFEKHHLRVPQGFGLVFHASGNNYKLAFFHWHITVLKMHYQFSFDHKEKLVFMIMVVPNKLSREFDQLHQLPVQLGHNLRTPRFLKEAEFLREIYFAQGSSPIQKIRWEDLVTKWNAINLASTLPLIRRKLGLARNMDICNTIMIAKLLTHSFCHSLFAENRKGPISPQAT